MLCENLKRIRNEKGKSIGVLAYESGLSISTIKLLENNSVANPRLSTLKKLSRTLDVPINVLIA